jgi:hypothetical protein
MTSEANYEATVEHFEENDYFGLNPDDVIFFKQGMWPGMTAEGKIILDRPDHIFMSPDGHGGVISALKANGCFADMRKRGVNTIFFFQVDNPLVEVADPAFIGDKEGMQYLIESYVYQITPGASTPFTAHMETDDCVVNASSAGTGTVTLSAFGGKSTTVSVTMKVGSLTFIGHQTGKNYGTVQKGGSLTINKVDLDSRPGLGNIEAIEVWRNVGSGKDDSSLCDHGFLTWKSDKVSYDPFDYGVLNGNLSGTHVITLTEFDPSISDTLTINNPQI